MRVADVRCAKCLGYVGWQFAEDLSPGLPNRNQVGRFGLCLSSIRREPRPQARLGAGAEQAAAPRLQAERSFPKLNPRPLLDENSEGSDSEDTDSWSPSW